MLRRKTVMYYKIRLCYLTYRQKVTRSTHFSFQLYKIKIDSAYLFEKVNVNGPTSNSVSKCLLYRLWMRQRFIEYLNDAD